jgi:hypothetical protein
VKIDIQLTQADIVKLIVAGLEVSGHVDKDEIKPDSVHFRHQGSLITNLSADISIYEEIEAPKIMGWPDGLGVLE